MAGVEGSPDFFPYLKEGESRPRLVTFTKFRLPIPRSLHLVLREDAIAREPHVPSERRFPWRGIMVVSGLWLVWFM